jgi:DNA-binding FadR family transcriptional regulator
LVPLLNQLNGEGGLKQQPTPQARSKRIRIGLILNERPMGDRVVCHCISRPPARGINLLLPISRDTLRQQASDTLKRFILNEDLACGAQLPSERELSEMLTISRNIVREALSALVAEGIIVKQVGKGTFVSDFDRNLLQSSLSLPLTVGQNGPSLRTLREARAALEIGAVGLMVLRITDDEIDRLDRILTLYERKHHEGKSTIKEDIEFHVALFECTKNEVIVDMVPLIKEVFRRTLVEDPSIIPHNPDRIIVEHRRILNALKARNVTELRAAMHEHFQLQDLPV